MRLADGSFFYPLLVRLAPTADWRPSELELAVPPDVTSISIFHFLDGVGFLDTDELSFRRIE